MDETSRSKYAPTHSTGCSEFLQTHTEFIMTIMIYLILANIFIMAHL